MQIKSLAAENFRLLASKEKNKIRNYYYLREKNDDISHLESFITELKTDSRTVII